MSLASDPQVTEPELAARIQDGVPGAFEEMVRLYQADVRVMTRRHLKPWAADEVAQEVFVQLFRSIETFRGDSSLRTWILAVTRNQIRMFLRTESRRQRRSEALISPELLEAELATTEHDPFHALKAEHELTALQKCLDKLDERPGQIVKAFYYRGQSAESIAAERQQKPGAIRMLLMRLRKRLGDCVRSQLQGTGEVTS